MKEKKKGNGRGEYSMNSNPKPVPKKASSMGITSWSEQKGKLDSMVKKAKSQNGI